MKKNGFITPIVLVICFILFSSLVYEIKSLEQERIFLVEEKEAFLLQQLLQMGTTDILNAIKVQTNIENGRFSYEIGTVTYQISQKSDEEIVIRLKAVTKQGRTNQADLYYNLSMQMLTGWKEEIS